VSHWSRTTLGELCDESGGDIQTGPFGSQLHAADYVSSGVPSVMPTNIADNFIEITDIANITFADAERLAKYRLRPGDIVYSRRGDVEKRALVRLENDGWLCGTGCLRVRFGERTAVDPAFVSYALGTEGSRSWIVRHAVGATMPNLNTSILRALPISIPPLAEQRAMAEVLGGLDDKILANTRLAATSDELIRRLFLYAAEDATKAKPIGLLLRDVRELAAPSGMANDLPYVGLEHVPRRSLWMNMIGTAGEVTSSKWRFQPGDVLFGKLRPYFHKVVVARVSGVCSTDIMVCRPISTAAAGFAMAAISSDKVVAHVTAASEGTRMPRTSWKELSAVEVPWPGDRRAEEISTQVSQVREAAEAVMRENLTLAALRDTLLPQLMSGRLRVRDAEKRVEAVV
jgi:type I restriction enzyme S subunit